MEQSGHINYELIDCSGWELGPEHSDGYPEDGHNNNDCENQLAPFAPIHFMASISSWEVVLRDIPSQYYEYGFWGAVELYTGLNEEEFYKQFNETMRLTNWEDISMTYAPEGWNIPDESIDAHVDFYNIDYFKR